MRAVIDTNVLIDYLVGRPEAKAELGRYGDPTISRITWLEVLVGAAPGDDEREVRAFLASFRLREIDRQVAEEALLARKSHGMRLPDAIVLGTARALGCLLVSRNTRDFSPEWPDVRVPYRL